MMRPGSLGGLLRQTGSSFTYLMLAFPLGLLYFVFLTTGLTVGLSLAVIAWGIPILLGVAIAWWYLAKMERWLTIRLLGAYIGPMRRRPLTGLTWTERLKEPCGNRITWTSLLYLFLHFPFGLLAFCFGVGLLSVSLAFITAPAYYHWTDLELFVDGDASWAVDSWWEAALLSLAGVALLAVSLALIYGLGRIWRVAAEVMLGYRDDDSARGVSEQASPSIAPPGLPERVPPPKVGDALSRLI